MAPYRKNEARDWAKEHLRGVANVVIPSFSADLRRLNEKGILAEASMSNIFLIVGHFSFYGGHYEILGFPFIHYRVMDY